MSRSVPWIDWAEWSTIREQIFSDEQYMVSKAILRIATWRSRCASWLECRETITFFPVPQTLMPAAAGVNMNCSEIVHATGTPQRPAANRSLVDSHTF